MNRKILIKTFAIVLLAVMFVINISECITVKAATTKDYIDIYNNDDTDVTDKGGSDIKKIINRVIGVVQVIGVFIAVVMLISLGIKYMYASPGDRAQIKNHLTVYVIGAVVMFGAAGILQILKDFFLDATKA